MSETSHCLLLLFLVYNCSSIKISLLHSKQNFRLQEYKLPTQPSAEQTKWMNEWRQLIILNYTENWYNFFSFTIHNFCTCGYHESLEIMSEWCNPWLLVGILYRNYFGYCWQVVDKYWHKDLYRTKYECLATINWNINEEHDHDRVVYSLNSRNLSYWLFHISINEFGRNILFIGMNDYCALNSDLELADVGNRKHIFELLAIILFADFCNYEHLSHLHRVAFWK